ncbi:YbbR-like domain-containing protein [Mucilaginibacter sp. X5P1]|uniref:CdaR family protein n=1 Tax=Mucilaginibacter sp. X5P1 TaxID=2723088 RepID=UPI00160D8982|nr:YbbR-like domain-containing protein [Mucilaginibacter sp. X5P1]MBB6137450.1 YbbR domain-containing protein [Mucilaginibacter sp. X5P1]
MAIVKLSAGERRRLSAFFTCLVLASLAWLFTTLSKPYDYHVKRVLTYKNSPQKRAFHSLQSDTVEVTVKGTGWQMLFSKMNDENTPIAADLRSLDNGNFVVLSSQLKQINDKDANHEIIAINPDTLYFDFSYRMVKRVPVHLVAALKYQQQFAQSNNPIVKPAYVTLTGPANRISKITQWDTDSLIAEDVNETIRTKLNMQAVSEGNMSMYPKAVDVVVPVDEFTEKTLQIPVKIINNFDYYNVKIFPQKVKVTFVTSLKKYAEINEDFFEAESDLNLWRLQGYTILPVKLIRYPPFCKIVRIDPPNIDFIIRK